MMRLRIVSLVAAAGLAFGAIAAPIAAASNGTGSQAQSYGHFPALYTVPVTGMTKSGKQFKGTFGIQRFVTGLNSATGKKSAWAVGTLKGTLGGQRVTRYGVKMLADLNNSTSGSARDAAASCPVLNLVLGPLHLDLLGLVVDLNQVTLNITAIPGAGNLLGNLLCGVSNLLNSNGTLAALEGDITALTAQLNGILGLLSGI